MPGLCSMPVSPRPPIPGMVVELEEVEEVVVVLVVLVVLLEAVVEVVVVGVVPEEGLVVVVVVVEELRGAQGFGRGSLFSRPACALSTVTVMVRHCVEWHAVVLLLQATLTVVMWNDVTKRWHNKHIPLPSHSCRMMLQYYIKAYFLLISLKHKYINLKLH